jgi:type VI protein secretion system component VasK
LTIEPQQKFPMETLFANILDRTGFRRRLVGKRSLSRSDGFRITVLLSLVLWLAACSTISTYDQTAYLQAVNTKVDALTLMSKATDSYGNHLSDVAAFQNELDKAYEYERGRPLNKDTIAQWDILRDPNRDLLGGFLKEWKESGRLLPVYVERKKTQIGEAFDKIIELESGKIKSASG